MRADGVLAGIQGCAVVSSAVDARLAVDFALTLILPSLLIRS